MALLIYKEGLNMIILDQTMGEQMIGVCHAANVANRVIDTSVKGVDLETGYARHSTNWSPQK